MDEYSRILIEGFEWFYVWLVSGRRRRLCLLKIRLTRKGSGDIVVIEGEGNEWDVFQEKR